MQRDARDCSAESQAWGKTENGTQEELHGY
jgi:hypothetical protein